MKNNDGQTPKILSVVLPAFCTAGVDCGQQCLSQLPSAQPGLGWAWAQLGLSSGSAAPFPWLLLAPVLWRRLGGALEETEQNGELLEYFPFFPSPGTNPLGMM